MTHDQLKTFANWHYVVDWFKTHSDHTLCEDKSHLPLFSPALFTADTKRSNENVQDWGGLLVADIDQLGKAQIPALEKYAGYVAYSEQALLDAENDIGNIIWKYLVSMFPGMNFFMHSTASCTTGMPKIRLIVPLNEHITPDKVPSVWSGFSNYIHAKSKISIDPQVKDPSRAYYLPGTIFDYQEIRQKNLKFWGAIVNQNSLDTDMLLDKYSTYRPPSKQRSVITDEIKTKYNDWATAYKDLNPNHHWKSYRDCAYFPSKLAADYANIVGAGWYITIYKIMCGIAVRAKRDKCTITATQIAEMIKEFDRDHGGWYQDRPLEREAQNAITFAKNV